MVVYLVIGYGAFCTLAFEEFKRTILIAVATGNQCTKC